MARLQTDLSESDVEIPAELCEALRLFLRPGQEIPSDTDLPGGVQDPDRDGYLNVDPAILASVFDYALQESDIASLIDDPDLFLDTLVAETLGYDDVDGIPTITDARIILDRALDAYLESDNTPTPYFGDAEVDAFWNAVLASGIVTTSDPSKENS